MPIALASVPMLHGSDGMLPQPPLQLPQDTLGSTHHVHSGWPGHDAEALNWQGAMVAFQRSSGSCSAWSSHTTEPAGDGINLSLR